MYCPSPQVGNVNMMAVDEFNGYGKIAALQDSDPNFLQFRKFGWLNNNILLVLQEELEKIETELKEYFTWEWEHGRQQRLRSRAVDRGYPESEWLELVTKAKAKLNRYDTISWSSK